MLKVYINNETKTALSEANEFKNAKICIFGFNALKKISYKNELSGAENTLNKLAVLSRETKKVIIAGAITDNYGVLRKSAVIADAGKLLGISDMTLSVDGSEFSGGGGFKVYQTTAGRIGLLVGDDIISLEGVKAMALCDADVIIGVLSGEEKPQHNFLIRAYAYLFGVPVCLVTSSGVIASDMSGEICGKSLENKANIIIPTKKQYVLIKSKRRGVKEQL